MRCELRSTILGALVTVLASGATFARPQQSSAVAATTQDSVPRLVQFNGTLKDSAARPVAGVASVTFAIYADQDGGSALWSETQNVIADANGHFATLLGGATANGMPAELFGTGQSRWLGITIARQQEMPRVLLASVPYALKAQDAETLGGIPASEYVTTKSLAAANTRATAPIVNNGTTIVSTPQSATTSATAAASQAAIPDTIPQLPIAGYIAVFLNQTQTGDSVIFQSPSNKIGIGTQAPAATLDINGGEILRGGFYEYPEDVATATNGGRPSHSFQWLASAFNSTTMQSVDYAFGFKAVQLGNNTSTPGAKLDLFYGTGGPTGTISDTGLSVGSTGVITFVPSQTFNGSSQSLSGSLSLPATSNSATGVINLGGSPFISAFGNPTNVWIGGQSGGAFATSGSNGYDTAVGYASLQQNTTGAFNAAFGAFTLQQNTTGSGETALGAFSLESNTTGQENTAVGDSLTNNTTGSYNSGFGPGSLFANNSGSFNTAYGGEALAANTTGYENTGIGYESGENNATGTSDTFLGYDSGATADGFTNATAVGADALVGESNAVVLGGTGGAAVKVGVGTTTPRSLLDLVASVGSGPTAPSPILTMTNTYGSGAVALDFNTSTPSTTGTYNPAARIEVSGSPSGFVQFMTNKSGTANGGLATTMSIDSYGNVTIEGSLYVGGELEKGSGTFIIDDPIDPANKMLSHSFVESPDMMNIYNGSVTLDDKGEAVVEMPDWFDALNRSFQYQLTAIGSPASGLFIAEKMNGNHFKIAGGAKGQEISWQVTGIRHDAWANAHRTPVEQLKTPEQQGKYLHPEAFGEPAEMSMRPVPGGGH